MRATYSKKDYWYTRVADVGDRYEYLKWVVLIRFPDTALYVSLYSRLTFFSVTETRGQKKLLTA
jgi:hypothetical protein